MDNRPKIALCLPNFNWGQENRVTWNTLPYALCILAAAIRDVCDVDIIDAHKEELSEEAFREKIGKNKYDVVGISVPMDVFVVSGHTAAKLAREALPKADILLGGVYPTMNPREALENSDADFVFIGEGERTLPALLAHLFRGDVMPERGLAFRRNGEIVIQEKAPFIENLDSLPEPAYDLVDFMAYASWFPEGSMNRPPAFPFAEIMTSRGCPQNCCFCQAIEISGRKIRVQSSESVLAHIARLKEKYGIRSILFVDDNLVAVRRRAVDIFQGMIDRELAMPWKAMSMAIFRLDEELIALMRASGCECMSISIESGTPRVLKEIIGKPIDLNRAKTLTAAARRSGIRVLANFVIGFPGETWEEIRRTFAYAEELEADYVRFQPAIPLKNTRLWDLCVKEEAFREGFARDGAKWYQGQIHSPEFDPREMTLLATYEWDRINFSRPEKISVAADLLGSDENSVNAMRRKTRESALALLSGGV